MNNGNLRTVSEKEIAQMIGAESGKTIAFGQNSSSLFNIFAMD